MLGAAALGVVLSGLAVNHAILSAADVRNLGLRPSLSDAIVHGVRTFPPLANYYRHFLLAEAVHEWPRLHALDPDRAAALLQWIDAEAQEALRAEPSNWRIQRALARLYHAAATTDPGHEAAARRHLVRARALAPNRELFPAPLPPPEPLGAQRLADGRIELRIRPSPGAGYHQIARSSRPGAWRTFRFAYGAGRSAFIVPAGDFRYRIRACRRPEDCTDWEEWP